MKVKSYDGKCQIEFEKTEIPQAISQPTDSSVTTKKSYNTYGQRVGETTKGIIIQNNKKHVVK